jgi:hypothetical protein
MSCETSMYAGGQSDEQVVLAKRPNKGEQSPAEGVDGSCSAKGNTDEALFEEQVRCRGHWRGGAGI